MLKLRAHPGNKMAAGRKPEDSNLVWIDMPLRGVKRTNPTVRCASSNAIGLERRISSMYGPENGRYSTHTRDPWTASRRPQCLPDDARLMPPRDTRDRTSYSLGKDRIVLETSSQPWLPSTIVHLQDPSLAPRPLCKQAPFSASGIASSEFPLVAKSSIRRKRRCSESPLCVSAFAGPIRTLFR